MVKVKARHSERFSIAKEKARCSEEKNELKTSLGFATAKRLAMMKLSFAAGKRFATTKSLLITVKVEDDIWVHHNKEAFAAVKVGGLKHQTSIFEPIISPFSKAYKYKFL